MAQESRSQASIYWYMRENKGGTVSMSLRCPTVLFQQYSANRSVKAGPGPSKGVLRSNHQAAPKVRLPCTCHFCACRARRENPQCLAKSSPYAGPSAGTEVARLRKWHVWCILVQCGLDSCEVASRRAALSCATCFIWAGCYLGNLLSWQQKKNARKYEI